MTYQEQLKHPEWQRKRLEVLESNNFTCQDCGDKEKTLHVHHKIYRKGKKPWEYSLNEYDCLCEDCHKDAHAREDELKELTARLGQFDKEVVIGYVKAILSCHGETGLRLRGPCEMEGASDFLRVDEGLPQVSLPADGGLPAFDGMALDDLTIVAKDVIHGGKFHRRRLGGS